MMARRKIVILVAGLAALATVLGVGLGGCKDLTFNGDMKGYLEYWTATVSVAAADSNLGDVGQRDSSGRTTVATNATITASLTISNPEGYPLESVVSHASGGPHAVEVSGPAAGTVLGLTKVTAATPTSLEVRIEPYAQVPSWESRRLEHTDFTVRLSPTRSDTAMQSPNPLVLSLRYNTPPRMPLEVVDDGLGNLGWLSSGQRWSTATGGSNSGKIFWAWPADKTAEGGCSPTDPDYAARFCIEDNGQRTFADPGSKQGQTLRGGDGTVYNIYEHQATSTSVTVYAVDGEGVMGAGIVSGELHEITLDANGGKFENGSDSVKVYRSRNPQPTGATPLLTGGDLDVPAPPSGKDLVGWSETKDGDPIAFPYEVKQAAATLYALWEEDREWQDGINRKTGEYEKPQYSSGSYQVSNPGNLLWIAQQVKNGAEQDADVTLTTDITVPDNKWQPIGTMRRSYTGTFDGDNHTIDLGSQAVGGAGDAYGLFGNVAGATVQDLSLEGSVTMNRTSAGADNHYGVVAIASGNTTVTNVHSAVNLTIRDGFDRAGTGGIVGACPGQNSNLTIERCSFSGTIDAGTAYIDILGGILAYREAASNNKASLKDCLFEGEIKAHLGQIGGLVGYSRLAALTVKNCLVVGKITASDYEKVGYIAGLILQHGTANQDITGKYYRDHGVQGLNSFGDAQTDHDLYKANTDDIGEFNGQTREGSATKATEEELKDGTILGKLNASGSNWEYTNGTYPTLKNP